MITNETKQYLVKEEVLKEGLKASREAKSGAREKLLKLLKAFPPITNVQELFDKNVTESKWKDFKETFSSKEILRFNSYIRFLLRLVLSYEKLHLLFQNAMPGLFFDIIFFSKIGSMAPAAFFRKNPEKIKMLPPKNLIRPNDFKLEAPELDEKQMYTNALYYDLKVYAAIIDIGMAIDPKILFTEKGWDELFENDEYFWKAAKIEPTLLQTLSAVLKIKFFMNFRNEADRKKISDVLKEEPLDRDAEDITALRRIVFIIGVFEPEIFKILSDKDILSILAKNNYCEIEYKAQSLKKIRQSIVNLI